LQEEKAIVQQEMEQLTQEMKASFERERQAMAKVR
jgi:hypothetical protein